MDVSKAVGELKLDAPIKSQHDDGLGMKGSADAIARFCLEQDGFDSYVIGIYGEWGSGKTSYINLIKESIANLSGSRPIDKEPVCMSFDPWACDASEPMLRRFLSALASSLSKGSSKMKKAKNVAKQIQRYADAATPLIPVPGIGNLASAALESFAESGEAIETLKDSVSKKFEKFGRRVIVFIDDLDRLPDSQIRAVFQLVNHTASFSGLTYVLAFDHEVVATALDGTQAGTGADYIRKIVQVPFSVPRFSTTTIMGYFLGLVESHFEGIHSADFDRMHFYSVRTSVLEPALRTLREAKRIYNAFAINYTNLAEELDLTDLIALSVIEVYDPSLYAWVHDNKDTVCLPDYSPEIRKDYAERYDENLRKSLVSLYRGDDLAVKRALSMLENLFPKVAGHGRTSGLEMSRAYRRIASPAYFDLYFSADKSTVPVPRADFEQLVNPDDRESAGALLATACQSKKLIDLLEELRCHKAHIVPGKEGIIVQSLAGMFGKSHEKVTSLFSLDADTRICFLINDLLRKIEIGVADDLVCSLIDEMDAENLIGASMWINNIELAYGRLTEKDAKPENQVVSLSALERIEKLFVEKAPLFAENVRVLRNRQAGTFLYLWHCLNRDEFVSFWEKTLAADRLHYAYLVVACSREWRSNPDRGWRCSDEPFEGLPRRPEIVNSLLGLKGRSELSELNDEELCMLISYVEGSDDSDIGRYYSEDEAMQHVAEWRGLE